MVLKSSAVLQEHCEVLKDVAQVSQILARADAVVEVAGVSLRLNGKIV